MTDVDKKMTFKKWAISVIIGVSSLVLLFMIAAVIFVFITLKETSISLLEEKTKKDYDPMTTIYEDVVYEEGSVIDKEEFKNFYQFSAEKTAFSDAYKKLEDAQVVSPVIDKKSLIQVDQTFRIKSLLSNDCKEIYCYQHYLPFDHMPSIFWKGLIGIEDQRYLDHFGIDFKSLFRALVTNLKKMRYAQGGSTISQQLVKNLFFTSEKTFTRKLKEMVVSIYVEGKFPKEKILEAYLNEVHWGALQGIKMKGVYSASLFYFGKRPSEITPYEGAILIGLLKGPGYYHPIRNLERLKQRANVVFRKLVSESFLPDDDSLVWSEQKWKSWSAYLKQQDEMRYHQSIWKALEDKDPSLSVYEKYVLIEKVQNIKQKIKNRFDKKYNTNDISVKVLIGEVQTQNWYSFYSRIERNREKAINVEKHQVGSTIKPIIYSVFQEMGLDIKGDVSTEELTLELKSGDWAPREAHSVERTEISVIEALLKSYNRPVIRIAQELGFEELGLRLEDYFPKLKLPLSEYPSQLLGSIELSVSELKEAYAKFVISECQKLKNGERVESDSILSILSDPNQTTVERAVDDVMRRVRFFGKTGTTNNSYDNWFVAFDGKNITVVWVGYEGERSTKSLGLYGSTTAFDVFQNFYRDRGKRFQHFSCDLIN